MEERTDNFEKETNLSSESERAKFSFAPIEDDVREDTKDKLQSVANAQAVPTRPQYEPSQQRVGNFDGSGYQEESKPKDAPTAKYTEQNSKERKSRSFGSIVAVALICSLLGGIFGSGLTMALSSKYQQNSTGITHVMPYDIDTASVSPATSVANACMPTVVSIINTSTEVYNFMGMTYAQDQQASGSGVIISDEGHIVTNYHVIENASKLVVLLHDGRSFEAEIIGGDAETDLAVIQIHADNLTVAAIGDSDLLQVGEMVIAIGNPLDATAFAWTVTDGIVSGLGRVIEKDSQNYKLIQTNAAINAGNSGGALLNAKGELVGINTLKIASESVEGMGFAIPINDAMPIVEQLIEKGYISKPYIGIAGYDLTDSLREQIKCDTKEGILVTQIVENGAAHRGGLQIGDVIYEANGTKIKNFDEFKDVLAQCQVGDMLTIKVERQGEKISLGIIVQEKNSKMSLQEAPQVNQQSMPFWFNP